MHPDPERENKRNQERSREEARAEILAHNEEMLETEGSDVMIDESMGGNAGYEVIDAKQWSCFAMNGVLDSKTGKILACGNVQNIKREIYAAGKPFLLRIAQFPISIKDIEAVMKGQRESIPSKRIVHVTLPKNISEDARAIMTDTVRAWNARHAEMRRADFETLKQ